ncbi:MAG: hypothetical protein COA92_00580 [Sulfurovum sp.]|nr:MAG: hypothetical protein COA92_00580 [Sulfurovum sp.]
MNKVIIILAMMTLFILADDIKLSDVEAKYTSTSTIESTKDLRQSINLGFANTTGNTETLNLNGKYTLGFSTSGYNNQELKTAFEISAYLTKNNDVTDNEEYTAKLSLEQHIIDGWLGYASFYWLSNTFRNFDNKFIYGAGMGKEIFKHEKHSLKMKLGVAYNIEQYSNDQPEHTFLALTEYVEYNYHLNEISLFYMKIGALENFDNFDDYEILTVSGFNFSVAENLSVTIEGEIRYDNIPPLGFTKTDTKSIVRVGYDF